MKLRKIFTSLLVIAMAVTTFSTEAFAFTANDTHAYVTEVGANVLIDTMGSDYADFYTDDVIETLMTYSKKPDEDETDGINMWHFYNPNTGKNFNGGSVTALSKFTSHYNNAVSYYNDGQEDDAWESLGRALHYLGDLNTPVHTNNQSLADAGTGLRSHISFEAKCEEIKEDYEVTMSSGSYRYYQNNTVTNIGKACANMASDNFNAMKNQTSTVETVAGNSILNAERAISGILYKFKIDVGA